MNEKEPEKNQKAWIKMLFYVIEGNNRKFFIALVFGLLSNVFISISNPLALKYLFDEGIIKGNFKFFVILGISFLLIFTVWRTTNYFYRVYVQKLKINIIKNLCFRMIDKFYRIPYGEIIKNNQGYYSSRVYDEVISAAGPTVDSFFSLFNTLITLIIGMVLILFLSWRASITIVIAIPLVYLVCRKYSKKIKSESKVEKEEESKLRGVLTRMISSYKIAKTFGLQPTAVKKVTGFFDNYAEAFTVRFKSGVKYETISGVFMSYAETIAIIGGGYEILAGRLSFGGYMAFINAYWMVIGSARGLFNLVPELSRISGTVDRLKEFEELDEHSPTLRLSNEVQMERVNFAYDSKTVLKNFNFRSDDKERILIVGPNGSGKSTLAHLIAGFLSPDSGSVTTHPLKRISAVIYPSDFIPGTVSDNLEFIKSKDKSEKTSELLSEFGLEPFLGEDPTNFSAGQRKKLEIAMGLLKDAEVYVFDEPLAGIDIDSKDKIMNNIFSWTEDKILIVIMHGDESYHTLFNRIIDLRENVFDLKAKRENKVSTSISG